VSLKWIGHSTEHSMGCSLCSLPPPSLEAGEQCSKEREGVGVQVTAPNLQPATRAWMGMLSLSFF